MTRVLVRGRDAEGRLSEDRDRLGGDSDASPGGPKPPSAGRGRKDPLLEPPGVAQPCSHPDSELLASCV